MMSISQISSAGAASSYYQSDNYYAKEGKDGQGIWVGQAAKELGLAGKDVSPDQFKSILAGELPNGQKLFRVVADEKKHIPGYDITFSAPKSVSIMSEVLGWHEYRKAHDKAVKSTLEKVETMFLKTRKFNKKSGKQETIGNQKMIAALFTHDVSRNQDPQLHTHCVIANAVQGENGKFRSIHSRELFTNKMLIGAIYRSELAKNIQEQNLARINRTHPDGRFELRHMDKKLIKEFSTRAKDIEEYLGEGPHNAKDKAIAALRTRNSKVECSREELKEGWNVRLEQLGYSKDQIVKAVDYSRSIALAFEPHAPMDEKTALENSVEHLTEYSSTFPRRDILRFMLSEGIGSFRIDDAENQLQNAINEGWIKESKDKSLLYTQTTLERETTTLALEKSGRSAVDPILPRRAVSEIYNGYELTTGQYNSSKLILTSPNRTIGVQGYAGTGKTFMLASAAEQAVDAGYTVLGMAPTSTATKTLGEDAKIKSQTLQRYLIEPSGNHKTILFVDEASMISTRQMMDLLTIAEERGIAKIVLVGDKKQLEGVAAGAPFKMLQAEGMRYEVMDDIKRQSKERHLEAVISASNGDIERAFINLGMTSVKCHWKTFPSRQQRPGLIARTARTLQLLLQPIRWLLR